MKNLRIFITKKISHKTFTLNINFLKILDENTTHIIREI